MTHVAILADCHWGVRNAAALFDENIVKFYKEIFWPTIDERRITEIIHLGDVLDRRKYVTIQTANSFRRNFVDQLIWRNAQGRGIRLDVILGNHDCPLRNTLALNGPRELLPKTLSLNVIDKPQEMILGYRKILMLPWIVEQNREESLELIEKSDATMVMGHLELSGFEMERGRISEKGMSLLDFFRFELCLSGHYHHKSCKRNFLYTGATREQTWADWADQKGFHILNTNTLDFEFIHNPHTVFSKVEFGYKPGFCQIKDKIVRVTVPEQINASPVEIENFVKDINEMGPRELRVIQPKKEKKLANNEFNVDMLDLLLEAAENDVEDKDALKNILSDLYREAREISVRE